MPSTPWNLTPALLLTCWAAQDKGTRLSEPQCSHLASGAQAQTGINLGWFMEAQPKDAKAFWNCHVGISELCCNLTG